MRVNTLLQTRQKLKPASSHCAHPLPGRSPVAAVRACKPRRARRVQCAASSSNRTHKCYSSARHDCTFGASAAQHSHRNPVGPPAAASGVSDTQSAAGVHASAAADNDTADAAAGDELRRSDPDRYYMRRALGLAQRGVGKTHPNPAVGSVIVRDGEVVGEGFHPRAGMPHAEVYALRAAGQRAQGATAYVTLEPCAHYGRTPPCALALVDAGVARVVVGVTDPNPLVGGAGIRILQDAGIEVVSGVEEDSCYAINREFMERMAAQAAEKVIAQQAQK